ncbi:MAG: hypothetical protein JSS66_03350 [Armatimonadetes bacterium]|nr:hypothetical protein [Armatimonadota bacterium]
MNNPNPKEHPYNQGSHLTNEVAMGSNKLSITVAVAALALPLTSTAQSYVAEDLNPSGYAGSYMYRGSASQYAGALILPGGVYHAGTFQNSNWSDLHPLGSTESWAYETLSGTTVGYAVFGGSAHAMVWQGTSGAYSDFHPAGYDQSGIAGYQGRQMAGWTYMNTPGIYHAAVWTSTGRHTDVHPAAWANSQINATDGRFQAGSVSNSTYSIQHAALWQGAAASFVDLNPTWAATSWANHVLKNVQVGASTVNGQTMATIWTGTRASGRSIHPTGAYTSEAFGVSKGITVGTFTAGPSMPVRACVLDASFGFVDLHKFLPTNYTASVAYGIDPSGNILGYAGVGGATHAVIWRR